MLFIYKWTREKIQSNSSHLHFTNTRKHQTMQNFTLDDGL